MVVDGYSEEDLKFGFGEEAWEVIYNVKDGFHLSTY
jgi:hypothetical protein